MNRSDYAKLSIQVFVLLIASMLCYVAFVGGYSALIILEDEDNIDLNAKFAGDIMNDPSSFELEIDFTINNKGYTDLENPTIEMELLMIYHNNDKSGKAVEVSIFDDNKSFDSIKAGEEKTMTINIEYKDISDVNWGEILSNADPKYDIVFTAEHIIISAKYSYSLLSFSVELEDVELGKYYF